MTTNEFTLQKSRALHWRRYLDLTKFKVVTLILFTTLVGMLLASSGPVPWQLLICGLLGIGMAAAAGAAYNHIIDRHLDGVMERTRGRPLPTGDLDTRHALIFASLLAIVSMMTLVLFVNLLTAVLTFVALIGYVIFYTLFLKRRTPQNIVWGGIAGAMPPLLGWTSVTGELHSHAMLLVLLIFVWTPPHFWALAIKRCDEYARAGLPMLPVTHGVAFTKQQILLYTLMLFAVSLMPYGAQMSGEIYLVGAVLLGAGFIYRAMRLWRLTKDEDGDGEAMATFTYSIIYLTGLFALLLVDHYLWV